jgi:acyl-CoA synthetase (AMP-forming)/AMP-acid ligase II
MAELALAQLFDSVALCVPEREAIRHDSRSLSYRELRARTRALAGHLRSQGLGQVRPRSELQNWESGQDHVALYLYNGPEYIESMLACFDARVVPCNVNYRYSEGELVSLLRDMRARAIVFDAEFAPMVRVIRAALPELRVSIQVGGTSQLDGATAYESAANSAEELQLPAASPDDLYILYTGGTTGAPKGVLWRQADIFMAAFGGRDLAGDELQDLDALRGRVTSSGGARTLPLSPFMHGAAHWAALRALYSGDSVVLQDHARKFDADLALATAAREQVRTMLIIGDAFGRPLVDALDRGSYELHALRAIINGGAALSVETKRALLARLPGCLIVDALGASESGQQGLHVSTGEAASTGRFSRTSHTCVLDAERQRVLPAGDAEVGWLAQRGRVPLGYLGDPDKTQRTFPVVAGKRYAIPGDRARLLAGGVLEVFGRDSTTINSGGEKIFVEEVEAVLKRHPAVYDVLVCGRPSERWGQEVCAAVQLAPGQNATSDELTAHVAANLARYKVPRAFVFCERLERSPSGKPDYAWARSRFTQ